MTQEYPFTAEEGKAHEIIVTALEDDDFFKPLEERPTISFENVVHDIEDPASSGDQ